jgi:hypothetical protein
MNKRYHKDIGILLNWKPNFDLNTAYDVIKRRGKFAWSTGGVELIPPPDRLPDKEILGLVKRSGRDNILYGITVDISEEFREYLGTTKTRIRSLKKEHKKYIPDQWGNEKDRAFLFLSDIFMLNTIIPTRQIKIRNGNPFTSAHRSAVFIDLKKSKLDPNKIFNNRKKFDSFSNNPFVYISGYDEDGLTSAFAFLIKNIELIAKEFFSLCKINKEPINFNIYLRKQLENTQKRNIPDITFTWEDGDDKVLVEAKLDSPVNDKQLKRYSSGGKVICITLGEKGSTRGVRFISWGDIYRIIEKVSCKKQNHKILKKYFLDYLNFLGVSNVK